MRAERCQHPTAEKLAEDARVDLGGQQRRGDIYRCPCGAVCVQFADGTESNWLEPLHAHPLHDDASLLLLFGGCGCKAVQA